MECLVAAGATFTTALFSCQYSLANIAKELTRRSTPSRTCVSDFRVPRPKTTVDPLHTGTPPQEVISNYDAKVIRSSSDTCLSFAKRWHCWGGNQITKSGIRTKNQNGRASATMSLTSSSIPMICSAFKRIRGIEAAPMILPIFSISLGRANKAIRQKPPRLFLLGSRMCTNTRWKPDSQKRKNRVTSGPRH